MSFEETLAALLDARLVPLRAELAGVRAQLAAGRTSATDELAVSPARAGELVGFTAETVLGHIGAGHLRAHKPVGSREWRIFVEDLRRWVAAERQGMPALDMKGEAGMIVAKLAGGRR